MPGCRASQVTTVICQKEVFQTGVSAESLQEEERCVCCALKEGSIDESDGSFIYKYLSTSLPGSLMKKIQGDGFALHCVALRCDSTTTYLGITYDMRSLHKSFNQHSLGVWCVWYVIERRQQQHGWVDGWMDGYTVLEHGRRRRRRKGGRGRMDTCNIVV